MGIILQAGHIFPLELSPIVLGRILQAPPGWKWIIDAKPFQVPPEMLSCVYAQFLGGRCQGFNSFPKVIPLWSFASGNCLNVNIHRMLEILSTLGDGFAKDYSILFSICCVNKPYFILKITILTVQVIIIYQRKIPHNSLWSYLPPLNANYSAFVHFRSVWHSLLSPLRYSPVSQVLSKIF